MPDDAQRPDDDGEHPLAPEDQGEPAEVEGTCRKLLLKCPLPTRAAIALNNALGIIENEDGGCFSLINATL